VTGPERLGDVPFDCWYLAATADEIGPELTTRRMLGRSVLLYRTGDGAVVALDDRCAHRALPLSMGRLVDDRVVCRYHGFTYDSSGACVLVPSQEHVPYGARVASHPVREEGRLVWVWLGDPRRVTTAVPPHRQIRDTVARSCDIRHHTEVEHRIQRILFGQCFRSRCGRARQTTGAARCSCTRRCVAQ